MSFLFESEDGQNLWFPSLDVGLLYLGFAESTATVLKAESGLEDLHCDTAVVHSDPFSKFISLLVDAYSDSQHHVFRLELPPVILPGLVMLERADRTVEAAGPEHLLLLEQARQLGATMSRS